MRVKALCLCALAACVAQASEKEKASARIQYDLGVDNFSKGNITGALAAFEQAERNDAQFADLQSALGLVYLNARFYDPKLGRFIEPDTIAPDPLNSQTLNRYAFTYDNPAGTSAISPAMTGNWAPFFYSVDGGDTWGLQFVLPSTAGVGYPTGDVTSRFGGSSGAVYADAAVHPAKPALAGVEGTHCRGARRPARSGRG